MQKSIADNKKYALDVPKYIFILTFFVPESLPFNLEILSVNNIDRRILRCAVHEIFTRH